MRISTFLILLLFSLHGNSQELTPYLHLDTDDGLPQSTVWAIEEDLSGRIWLGTPGGIVIYDGFKLTKVPDISGIVLHLYRHDSGIYCLTDASLYRINSKNLEHSKVEFPYSGYYTPKFHDQEIRLVNAEGNQVYGYNYQLQPILSKASPHKKSQYVFEFTLPPFMFKGGENGTISDFMWVTSAYSSGYNKYSKNKAFIASHKGVVEIRVINGRRIIKSHFPNWRIEKLFVDHNKNLWIGTSDHGVVMIHKNALHSDYYPKSTKDKTPISCWTLFHINEQLYTATPNGLIPVEKDNWKDDAIYLATKTLACNTGIQGNGFILIGTRNDGIYQLKNNSLIQIHFNSKEKLDNTIIQILQNEMGYLVSTKASLIQLDHNARIVKKVSSHFESTGSYLMDLVPTETGYFGSQTVGIIELNSDLKKVRKTSHPKAKIISMLRNYQNQWWGVSMNAGLLKYKKDSIIPISFPDKHLFTLTNWNDTSLWISGVSSIYQYQNKMIRPYGYQNGFPMKEYNQSSNYLNDKGFLYYSGVKGIVKFHPDSMLLFPSPPNVWVSRNNQMLDSNQIIQLDFEQSELHLDFHPVIISDQNLYKIEIGIDSIWQELSSPKTFSFAIPYDSSKVQVRVTNLVNGTEHWKNYSIYRSPPFWNKAWFWVLIGITVTFLIIGLISFIGYLKTKKKLRNQLEDNKLKEERLRISKELHDNIGARLTHIISSLDVEIYRNKSNLNSIENINNFARDTMSQLRETIWAVGDHTIFFSEFLTRIEQYVDQINELASHQITYSNSSKSDFELNPVETINYYRIVQEGINNAVKYAKSTNINVAISQSGKSIMVSIQDAGKGFDITNTRLGSGLKGMKIRAEEVGATLTISSIPNKGTIIQLLLQIK